MENTTVYDLPESSDPIFALVGYENPSKLALHPIKDGRLQAEKCFRLKDAQTIFKTLETTDCLIPKMYCYKGIIPNVMIHSYQNEFDYKFIWHKAASSQFLEFSHTDIPNAVFKLPRLLFALENNKLSIFALKKGSINTDIILYNAPFYNVYANGGVCMGNVDLDISNFTYIDDIIKYVEQAFFQSQFTHAAHNNIINQNFTTYLKNQGDAISNFDNDLLIPTSLILKNLLHHGN